MNIEKLTDRSKGFLKSAEGYASRNSNQYFIRMNTQNFFSAIRDKLMWGSEVRQ